MKPVSLPTGLFHELTIYRRFLAMAAGVYLLWWVAVEAFLPETFNPFLGRALVVLCFIVSWAATFVNAKARKHVRAIFYVCVSLLTLHFFYLFAANDGAMNWVIGSYITVIAICLCLFSNASVLSFSVFVFAIALGMVVWIPHLRHSVFLPGLFTILLQANLGLRARLRTLKSLEESNILFRLLFNSTFEGVLVHEDRKIVRVNNSLAEMFGYEKEELIGQDPVNIIHPEYRPMVEESLKSNRAQPYEALGITKIGAPIEIEVRSRNVKLDRLSARLVTVQATGDRKRADREKLLAQSMIENVRIRDEFIAIASHELKTPLSTLKLQAQLLEADVQNGNPEIREPARIAEFVALINRQTNRLTELVNSMLDVSSMSMGRFQLTIAPFDLAWLVSESVTGLRPRIELTGSSLSVKAPQPIMVMADIHRIEQVIENLLTNAAKYGSGKPIAVDVRLENSHAAVVEVTDHGIGISQDGLERIFDRFERAVSSRNISGLGLGLYITKQIVEAHGGSIGVRSGIGQGSVFTVRLPLEARPPAFIAPATP